MGCYYQILKVIKVEQQENPKQTGKSHRYYANQSKGFDFVMKERDLNFVSLKLVAKQFPSAKKLL